MYKYRMMYYIVDVLRAQPLLLLLLLPSAPQPKQALLLRTIIKQGSLSAQPLQLHPLSMILILAIHAAMLLSVSAPDPADQRLSGPQPVISSVGDARTSVGTMLEGLQLGQVGRILS